MNQIEVNKVIEQSHTRNQRLYIASTYLMKASEEIAPMSAELSKTFFDLGDLMLSEMTINDKMEESEMEELIQDILNVE